MKILIFILTLTGSSVVWAFECASGNCWNGTGTTTYPSGWTYVGEWRDGERHGKGTFTLPNGEEYVGEWRDDERTGTGTYTWPSGIKYVGEFLYFEAHGEGTETHADGTVKAGVWQNGMYFRTKAEWDAKQKHDRIYRACLLDKGANLDMQVTDLKQIAVDE